MRTVFNQKPSYHQIVGDLAFILMEGGFKMKKSLFLGIIIGLVTFMSSGYQAHATDVGGIIDTDTTWNLAGSPYNITATIQIAEGVTLTVEPGVTVNGKINIYFEVWGTLEAIGSQTQYIEFNDVFIEVKGENALVDLEFVYYYGGIPYRVGFQSRGLLLRNSILQNIDHIYLFYPRDDCYIERNVFIGADYWVIYLNDPTNIYIRNNVFIESDYIGSENAPSGEIFVEYNSFLSIDRVAVGLSNSVNSKMTATNNYWNTTDPAVIESMIYDRNDDLNIYNYIEYEPFLTAPHPDTPTLNFVLANFSASHDFWGISSNSRFHGYIVWNY